MIREAVILGSGTSNGVPSLGYEYSDAFLADPKNHRTRPSLLLTGPEGNILVDCAPEIRLQLLRERVMMVEAVILTHTHADHVMGMDDLRSFCLVAGRAMPIYTLPEYFDDVRRIFPYAWHEVPTGHVPRFDLMVATNPLRLAGFEIQTFRVEHGPVPVIGLRVNDFAYVTDVSRIPEEAMEMLSGLDTLVLDAVRYAPHPNHFHWDRAVEVAGQIGARMTYFTHLSHDYSHEEHEATLPPNLRLAYDGLRIPLDQAPFGQSDPSL